MTELPDEQDGIDIEGLAGLYQCVRELVAERDSLQARIDAYEGELQAWEEMRELIRQSSLGTPEAEAARAAAPAGIGRALTLGSQYLARAEAAEAERDRLRADAILAKGVADAAAEAVGNIAEYARQAVEERDRQRAGVEGDRQRIWHGIVSWEERVVALNADGTLTETEHTHRPLGPFFDELCALVFQLDGGEVTDG